MKSKTEPKSTQGTPGPKRSRFSRLGIQVGSTNDVVAIREKWVEAGLMRCRRIVVTPWRTKPGLRLPMVTSGKCL
jgi:hypothetical protein